MSSILEDNLGCQWSDVWGQFYWKPDQWAWGKHGDWNEAEFDLEAEDFNLDQIVDSAVNWASSPSAPHHRIESLEIASNEATASLELKALPEYLKYAYLGRREILPVITAPHLTEQQEDSLMSILKRHKEAIG